MIDPGRRRFRHNGFGVIGHAKAGVLDHSQVIGAITNRQGVAGGDAPTGGEGLQRGQFFGRAQDRFHHPAGQAPASPFQFVGLLVVKTGGGGDLPGKMTETARHKGAKGAMGPHGGHQLPRPQGQVDALFVNQLQIVPPQTFQHAGPFAQGAGKIQLPRHGPFRDRRHMGLQVQQIGHFINAFGQTETGSTIAMVPPEDHILEGPPDVVAKRRKHLASIGKPLEDVELRVVNDEGVDVGTDVTGEIVARGPRLMNGYWGQADATADTIRDGWLYTGDLGYIDEDGYVYLNGRAKDFIKRGGEMVAPEEVENIIHAYEGVAECAVIGLPDETWGERVVAIVVKEPGAHVTEVSVKEVCQEHLAGFKRPEQVIFVDALPRNPLGKVLKRELRDLYGASS